MFSGSLGKKKSDYCLDTYVFFFFPSFGQFVYCDSDRSVVRRRDPSLGRLSRVVSGQMGYDACDVSVWALE